MSALHHRRHGALTRICVAAGLLGAMTVALPTAQAAYPDKPIRLVVPFPPGGSADATARYVGQKLAEKLGQPLVVDNRAGANGIIGMDAVAKAPADGYTLLMSDRGAFGINPALFKKLPYDSRRDYAFVGIAAWAPYVLLASNRVKASTIDQFVALARQSGCQLNYASFGVGSMAQLGAEALARQYKICLTHVPYKGGGPAIMAAVSGDVDITLATIGPALPFVKEGRAKAIAVGSARRSPLLPDVPAIVESGADADLVPRTWFGFALPAGTPAAVVDKVSASLRDILAARESIAYLMSNGLEPASGDPAEMSRVVKQDVARFADLIKAVGIQAE